MASSNGKGLRRCRRSAESHQIWRRVALRSPTLGRSQNRSWKSPLAGLILASPPIHQAPVRKQLRRQLDMTTRQESTPISQWRAIESCSTGRLTTSFGRLLNGPAPTPCATLRLRSQRGCECPVGRPNRGQDRNPDEVDTTAIAARLMPTRAAMVVVEGTRKGS